jgi:hypothetical protein
VNAEQQVWLMQKLPRKVGGRIFFVSHRQTRNNLGSRGVIGTIQQHVYFTLLLDPKNWKNKQMKTKIDLQIRNELIKRQRISFSDRT